MQGTREKDLELVVSGSWKVSGMASSEKTFLDEVLSNRDCLQLLSHQTSALVANNLMGVVGNVQGSLNLYIEFIIRKLPPAQMFSCAAARGAAITRQPQGIHRSWLDEKHLDQFLWEKDQPLLAKSG